MAPYFFCSSGNHLVRVVGVCLLALVLLVLQPRASAAQTPKKKLGGGINLPTASQIFPSVNAVEDYMVLLSNYTNSGDYELMYSIRTGLDDWDRAQPIPNLHKPRLDHMGSYCISHDGRFLLFASSRANGVGKFDIWISERKGSFWSQPRNPGKPVNSAGHEGNPSLSPDGNTLYFMRCDEMTVNEKSGCRLYRSRRRSGNSWSEPEPLPFNSGHDVTPRMLTDNRTLLFASGRAGGKGGLDLYLSREEAGGWTEPVALDYLNTPRNDEYVTVPAKGDVVYYTDRERDQYQIYKALIPEHLRPDPVLLLTGSVREAGSDQPVNGALLLVTDLQEDKPAGQTQSVAPNGSVFLALPGGREYGLTVAPIQPGFGFNSQHRDLRNLGRSAWEQPVFELPELLPGLKIPVPVTEFAGASDQLPPAMDHQLRNIARLLQMNPGLRLRIRAGRKAADVLPAAADSVPADSLGFHPMPFIAETIDSVLLPVDTIMSNGSEAPESADFSDQCAKLARSIADYLMAKGVPAERLEVATECIEPLPETDLLEFEVLD
jgi:hypothetical protein